MFSTFENCQEHPNSQIGGIYRVKNKQNIQRKVCMECIVKFKIPSEQILFKDEFVKQLHQKANQLSMNSILELCQSQQFFKTVLHRFDLFQEEITLIFTSIRDIIKRISEEDKAGDEKFIRLINQNLNPFECSQTELDFLVNFLESNIFEQWVNKKKFVSSNIQKTDVLFDRLLQNAYKTNHLIEQLHTNFTNEQAEESIIQLEGLEQFNNQLAKASFYLLKQQNRDQVYLKDGQVLRIQKYILGQKTEQSLHSLEKIKYLEFKGQYGINGYKIKQWNYFWKGQQVGGGLYNLKGQKQGNWIDLCDDYWDQKTVIEEGYYQQDQRIGVWNINWNNQQIGGGQYNEQGMKIGKWIELSDGFMDSSQLTYSGEYKNGKKVGIWDINCEGENIGGGSYDEEGDGFKIGRWNEIIDGLKDCSKITQNGEYKNGKKFGRWDIYQNWHEKQKIGGGSYDEEDEIKIGKWVDLSEGFERESQITYIGEYKNGKKVGRYDIWYKKNYGDYKNEQIGGGSYNEEGNGIKIGKWVEISERFRGDSQVIFRGEYINDKKIGRWEILSKEKGQEKFERIGGGQYNEEGYGIKIGQWIEIGNRFASYSQIIYNGEYQSSKKVGKWEIQYRKDENTPFKQIGGGSYDQSGIKIGNWIEISDRFWRDSQVIFRGEYKKGAKIGKWEILQKEKGKEKFEKIAGGQYHEAGDGIKIGQWTELDDGFNYNKQVVQKGEYKNGKKVGAWMEMDIKKTKSAMK